MPRAPLRYSPSIDDYAKDLPAATQQLWIFDCCHAGNALFFQHRGQAATAAAAFALHHAGKFAVRGLAAVSGVELSLEKDGSGVYTKSLVAAIEAQVQGPDKSCVSADLYSVVSRQVLVESGSKMTVQAGAMLMELGGMPCEGEFVLFNAKDAPRITDGNAPIEVVGDARGNTAAAEERARIREAKGRVAALESAHDCAGLVAAARDAADAEVAACTIKAIEYFAKTRAGKGEVVAAGGIDAVVAALKLHVAAADVAEAAMDVLAWMMNGDGGEDMRTTIAAAGGIESAIAAMYAHLDVAAVQVEGCSMLGNLAIDHPANKTAIAAAGGVECVMAALRAHPGAEPVQQQGCYALGNLAANHPASRTAIAAAGGVEGVIAAMHAHPGAAGVQDEGCTALGNLAAGHPANQTAIAAAGGVEGVMAAMRAHPGAAEVQRWGCSALGNLAANHPANQTAIAAAGGVEDVMAAMRAHPGAEAVVQQGSYVFYHLVNHQQAAVVASGAPALVASTTRMFQSNTTSFAYFWMVVFDRNIRAVDATSAGAPEATTAACWWSTRW